MAGLLDRSASQAQTTTEILCHGSVAQAGPCFEKQFALRLFVLNGRLVTEQLLTHVLPCSFPFSKYFNLEDTN